MLAVLLAFAGSAAAAEPDGLTPLFACSFDTSLAADVAGGQREPLERSGVALADGRSGKGLHLPDGAGPAHLVYSAAGNFAASAGSIDVHVRLDWDYTDSTSRAKRVWFDVSGGGKERYYLHSLQKGMVFGIFDDTGTVHAVYAAANTQWKKGEWHRVTCTWDLARRSMVIALDGVVESDRPSDGNKGSWRVTDAALKVLHIGGWGNNPLPIGGTLDDLRILPAPLPLTTAGAAPAVARATLQKGLQTAAAALHALEKAIAEAERAGVETAYAEAVATTGRTGLWRLTQGPVTPTADDLQRWGDYLGQRCPEAQAELAAVVRDRTREKRVPRPDVTGLTIDGDVFRDRHHDAVLLVGVRSVQPAEFAELSRFFNLLEWNGGAPDAWSAQAKQAGFAGQGHLFWNAQLRAELAAHPEMHNVGGWCGHNWATDLCIEAERTARVTAEGFSRLRLLRRSPDPSLAYLLLSAEDEYMCWCDASIRMFQDWLGQRYESVRALSQTWGVQLASFREVRPPRLQRGGIVPDNRAAWYDWQQFNRMRTTGFYAFLKAQVRRAWPAAAVCGGTHLHLADNRWGTVGVDPEELNRSVNDVIQSETMYDLPTGRSSWDRPNYGLDLFGESQLDFQRAICGKPATDLEFHAWLRFTEALHARHEALPRNYTYAVMLRHYLHGIRAANAWVWLKAPGGAQSPPSFASSPEQPPESVEELLRAALDVRRLTPEIVALSHARRHVGILVSDAAFMQIHPARARSHVPAPLTRELNNVAHGAMFLDAAIGYVTDRSIAAGALADYRIILVPANDHLSEATLAALLRFVEGGGHLIVTPRSFVFDEYHRPRPAPPGLPAIEVADYVGLLKPPTPEQLCNEDFLEQQDVDPGDPRTPIVELHPADASSLGLAGTVLQGAGIRLELGGDVGEIAARFADDGSPAIVRILRGAGSIHYCAIPLRPQSYSRLLDGVMRAANVERLVRLRAPRGGPVWGVEARSCREGDDVLVYAINLLAEPVEFELTSDRAIVAVHDHLKNQPGSTHVKLEGLGVAILRLKMGR